MDMPGKYPKLKCAEGYITECIAIAKYLAHGSSLIPSDPVQLAKMDAWLLYQVGDLAP